MIKNSKCTLADRYSKLTHDSKLKKYIIYGLTDMQTNLNTSMLRIGLPIISKEENALFLEVPAKAKHDLAETEDTK